MVVAEVPGELLAGPGGLPDPRGELGRPGDVDPSSDPGIPAGQVKDHGVVAAGDAVNGGAFGHGFAFHG
ncbi:MAG TPA: hypothetical protein VK784_01230 [Pseudonocardiaceae bacterium]|nr:hypothetical protein [Pseudonocardiaceae bacterium]